MTLIALAVAASLTPASSSGQTRYSGWAGLPAVGNVLAPVPVHPRPPPSYGKYRPRYGRWWPGQVLPPDAPATVVTDLARYHVRPAPPGYVWLLCDGDLVLAATSTGLITEVLPGGN